MNSEDRNPKFKGEIGDSVHLGWPRRRRGHAGSWRRGLAPTGLANHTGDCGQKHTPQWQPGNNPKRPIFSVGEFAKTPAKGHLVNLGQPNYFKVEGGGSRKTKPGTFNMKHSTFNAEGEAAGGGSRMDETKKARAGTFNMKHSTPNIQCRMETIADDWLTPQAEEREASEPRTHSAATALAKAEGGGSRKTKPGAFNLKHSTFNTEGEAAGGGSRMDETKKARAGTFNMKHSTSNVEGEAGNGDLQMDENNSITGNSGRAGPKPGCPAGQPYQ